ncbi:MAG: hypothetical protein IJ315_05880 [Firmicutes bacterium]|nr:hypothetical protein [Bacillota bacterium]
MNKLKAGFATLNSSPPLGIYIEGYYVPRQAKGVLDDLHVSAVAEAMTICAKEILETLKS